MKSRVFYLDEDNNVVDEDKSVKGVIQIIDDNGNFSSEVFLHRDICYGQQTNGEPISDEEFDKMIENERAKINNR